MSRSRYASGVAQRMATETVPRSLVRGRVGVRLAQVVLLLYFAKLACLLPLALPRAVEYWLVDSQLAAWSAGLAAWYCIERLHSTAAHAIGSSSGPSSSHAAAIAVKGTGRQPAELTFRFARAGSPGRRAWWVAAAIASIAGIPCVVIGFSLGFDDSQVFAPAKSLYVLFLAALAAVVLVGAARSRVTVALDRVVVHTAAGRVDVPLSDVVRLDASQDVVLELKDGDRMVVARRYPRHHPLFAVRDAERLEPLATELRTRLARQERS